MSDTDQDANFSWLSPDELEQVAPKRKRRGGTVEKCETHGRALTYAEMLVGACSWCDPETFRARRRRDASTRHDDNHSVE